MTEDALILDVDIIEQELTEKITKRVTAEVTQQVTEEVTQQVTQQVTEEVTQQVTEEVTRQITEEITQEVTEKVTKQKNEVIGNLIRQLRLLHLPEEKILSLTGMSKEELRLLSEKSAANMLT